MKKNSLIYLAAIIASMIMLALLLCFFESRDPDASIQTVLDALWYTIVTLTTVGYGDYYPVTGPGKIVGIVIVLCSLGVIANIIASIMNFLNGDVIPGLYLKKNSSKTWYVFSESNDRTECLMESIRNSSGADESLIICLSDRKKWNFSWEQIIELKKEAPDTLHLFFMDDTDNDYLNFSNAFAVYKNKVTDHIIPFHVYCLTEYKPEEIYVNLTCFHSYENTARLYWDEHRLVSPEEKIIIIGKGKYSSAILKFALQGNVTAPVQNVQYHLFMDEKDFCMKHYCLGDYFSVGETAPDRDSVVFHDGDWRGERELLGSADRIIFCDDDERVNLSAVSDLRRYYPLSDRIMIHVLSFSKFEDIETFGSDSDIFTEDLVIREKLNSIAVSMNEMYRKSSSTEQPDWNHLSEFKRQSNLAVADHVAYKISWLEAETAQQAGEKFSMTDETERTPFRRIEHDRWMRFHIVNNWKYAAERQNALRLHPDIRPFDELSAEAQAKDDYAWEILKEINYSKKQGRHE